MDGLLSQLRDIRGLDHVSFWPLAPGWWALLGVLTALAVFALIWLRRRRNDGTRWQSEALELVKSLRIAQDAGIKQQSTALSGLLRSVAIKRFGRGECAGLEGRSWLKWLSKNDPAGFSWDKKGLVLIEAPYLPDDTAPPSQNLSELLDAAEKWIK